MISGESTALKIIKIKQIETTARNEQKNKHSLEKTANIRHSPLLHCCCCIFSASSSSHTPYPLPIFAHRNQPLITTLHVARLLFPVSQHDYELCALFQITYQTTTKWLKIKTASMSGNIVVCISVCALFSLFPRTYFSLLLAYFFLVYVCCVCVFFSSYISVRIYLGMIFCFRGGRRELLCCIRIYSCGIRAGQCRCNASGSAHQYFSINYFALLFFCFLIKAAAELDAMDYYLCSSCLLHLL